MSIGGTEQISLAKLYSRGPDKDLGNFKALKNRFKID